MARRKALKAKEQPVTVNFSLLEGARAWLFGCDGTSFKLDHTVFEVVEDPDDGYRSYLEEVRIVSGGNFLDLPLAQVEIREPVGFDPTKVIGACPKAKNKARDWNLKAEKLRAEYHVRHGYDTEGWQLVDVATGHVWLTFGTDRMDDYYPCFVFQWNPDPELTPARMEQLHAGFKDRAVSDIDVKLNTPVAPVTQ